MGKMERDINKLCMHFCPEGVDYYKLGELGKFYGGLTGKNKSDFSDGNAKFISYRNVYNNPALKLDVEDKVKISSNEKQNTLERGDIIFTGSSETADECGLSSVVTQDVNEKIYLNSFCFIFRFKNPKIILPDFSKHLFRSEYLRHQIGKTASGVTRFNVSKKLMANVTIPLPPLPIQQEIVRILDTFTNLTAELTAELTARRKQYEYYRDELLTFGEDVAWTTLKCIADIGTGSSNTNEGLKEGKYPFFVRSQEPLRKNEYEYDETAIITAGDGVGVGKVYHFYEGKYALHQRAYRIHVNTEAMYPKFVFHYMRAKFLPYIEKTMFHGSVSSIRRPMLNKFPIPVLKVCDQKQIADILDKFDKLCEDISEGIPAEISARQKQYEYYRDQLLTFKRIGG